MSTDNNFMRACCGGGGGGVMLCKRKTFVLFNQLKAQVFL